MCVCVRSSLLKRAITVKKSSDFTKERRGGITCFFPTVLHSGLHEQVTGVIRCVRACPGYRRITCLAVRAQLMLFCPSYVTLHQLRSCWIICRLPSTPEADGYREYLSVFCFFLLPSIQTYIKDNIILRGSGGDTPSGGGAGRGGGVGPSSAS